MFSTQFISAGTDYSTYTHHVPAPYLRKTFAFSALPKTAEICICGLGFYRLFINGTEVTKGILAPYIANPDHFLYYDRYDIAPLLTEGKNAIGILLGNGILNCPGGKIWKFDEAPYRSAPKVALHLRCSLADGTVTEFEADESFKTHPGPILFDDLRCGEIYDARAEIADWNLPLFDDTAWQNATKAATPKGEPTLCTAEAITTVKELTPVAIRKGRIAPEPTVADNPYPLDAADCEGYLYDFGENLAGLVRLHVQGAPGQRISIQTGELLNEQGELDLWPMNFQPRGLNHRMVYTCAGGDETYIASFTYFGMRYCLVSGITAEQATDDLLTFEVKSSALPLCSGFSCSDDIINRLQKANYNANISNFYYFPTDCPHREKNGWTGDAALSAQQFLLQMRCENSLRVWLHNIRKAQTPQGQLPGIVPTGGWGYMHANGKGYSGPAWECVITELPYAIWLYRGDEQILRENAEAQLRYLRWLSQMRDRRGVIEKGLWDYLPVGYRSPGTPRTTSNTLLALEVCRKCIVMFNAIGFAEGKAYAEELYHSLRASARTLLLEPDGITVMGRGQGAQALGLAYGLFDPAEKPAAFQVLLRYIHESDDHLDTGILSNRVIFHLLAQNGQAELAYRMITRTDAPSFGHWIAKQDATALFEHFRTSDAPEKDPGSKNHHFYGDIAAWFFQYLAGIKINPYARDVNEVEISPCFIDSLTHAEGWHDLPAGRISAEWYRKGDEIELTVTVPEDCYGYLRLPEGWLLHKYYHQTILHSAEELEAGTTTYTLYKK